MLCVCRRSALSQRFGAARISRVHCGTSGGPTQCAGNGTERTPYRHTHRPRHRCAYGCTDRRSGRSAPRACMGNVGAGSSGRNNGRLASTGGGTSKGISTIVNPLASGIFRLPRP